MNNDYDFLYKLLLIGDPGVGKTNLITRYVEKTFTEYHTTLGVDFRLRMVDVDRTRIKLQIWDFAPIGEKFIAVLAAYYRHKDGILIVFDVTNMESFNNVTRWLEDIDKYAQEHVNKLLVGNKSDLDSKRVVTFEQGLEFAKSMGMEYIETSAKNSTNVDEAFRMLTSQIKERLKSEPRSVRLTAASKGKWENDAIAVNGTYFESGSCKESIPLYRMCYKYFEFSLFIVNERYYRILITIVKKRMNLLMIGDYGVGKSSLVMRYTDDTFTEGCVVTIGAKFKTRSVELDEAKINLKIWDITPRGEKFATITSSYYRQSHGILIMYDVADADSFNDVKYWLNEITKWASKNVNKLLVGNKSDLDSQRAVTFEEGQEFAKSMGMEYIETSAKNATNVDEAFLMLTSEINERMKSEAVSDENRGVRVSTASEGKGKNRCVCC